MTIAFSRRLLGFGNSKTFGWRWRGWSSSAVQGGSSQDKQESAVDYTHWSWRFPFSDAKQSTFVSLIDFFACLEISSDQQFPAIRTWRRVRRSRRHTVLSIAKTRTGTQSRAISTKITLKSRKAISRQVTRQLRYCCSYIFTRAGSSNHVSQGVNAGPHGHSFFKTLTHRLSRRYVLYNLNSSSKQHQLVAFEADAYARFS